MQQDAPSNQRRNRTRGRRQAPQQELEANRLEPHLVRCPLSLPVSTRAIGMAVGRFMMDLRDDLLDFSSSDDDEVLEGYLERHMPNWYQVYRLSLALFESKLVRVQRACWPRFPGYVDHSFDDVGMWAKWRWYDFPKHITEIVNALGIVRHGDLTFVPVVVEELYDTNGRLVPLPQSLLYSNLRRTVVALADPETPEQYRIEFEAYCPIPGAIWENHLLKNADEIMPSNCVFFDFKFHTRGRESLRGKLSDNTKGKISALVNMNKTRKFSMPPREEGQSLLNYRAGVCRVFHDSDLYASSFTKLTDDQMEEGLNLLMFGEVPNNAEHKSALYATRDDCVSYFNCGLTLSISTRGIGFYLARFVLQNDWLLKRVKLDIYATYRAFLGLLEIKMRTYQHQSWHQYCETYHSSFVGKIYELYRCGFKVPESIGRIISAVGDITIGQRTVVMGMAKERLDENGKLIPEPQNLLISNLRTTVAALSDPETPLHHREHFEQNCPIPGAIWDNHLLTNADEIIPANYSSNDLSADIEAWTKIAREHMGTRMNPPLTELTLAGDLGKRSAFVSVTMKRPMRVEPRQPGQELATYVPTFLPTHSLSCRSFVWLSREETAEGMASMLGERPMGETRQVYALRDPLVCGYKAVQKWNFGYRY